MPDKRLPTIEEMTGSDPNFTGGLDTDTYMREMRGRGPEALVTLRAALAAIVERQNSDVGRTQESDHQEADDALLQYIGDFEVAELFSRIEKWYA